MRHLLSNIDTNSKRATCSVCGVGSSIKRSEYSGDWRCYYLARVTKFQKDNPEKTKLKNERWNAKNPWSLRQSKWKSTGILSRVTGGPLKWAEFEAALIAQGSVCAICGSDNSRSKKGWCADHDHSSMLFRGVLCFTCNIGLGCYEKTGVTTFQSYLERFNGISQAT